MLPAGRPRAGERVLAAGLLEDRGRGLDDLVAQPIALAARLRSRTVSLIHLDDFTDVYRPCKTNDRNQTVVNLEPGMKPTRYPEGHPRRRQILVVLCLSLLVVVIDNTILNTALPTLARVLHASTADLQWITDAYTLVFAALLIVAGALGDRYGRRGALILGLAVFAAGSTAAALSTARRR